MTLKPRARSREVLSTFFQDGWALVPDDGPRQDESKEIIKYVRNVVAIMRDT